MRFPCTAIIRTNAGFQFCGAQQPLGLRHGPFAMHPFGLDGIEPGAFDGQPTRHNADPVPGALDALIVLPQPGSDRLTLVPRGVIPAQQQRGHPLGRQPLTAPRQEVDGDRTDGTPCHEAQQHLFRTGGLMPHQQAITGQRLGITIRLRAVQFLQPERRRTGTPTMLLGVSQAAPPDLVAPAQRPRRVALSQTDQPVALFFFRT